MTTVEVLKAARARIETGWAQGARAVNETGSYCALTATMFRNEREAEWLADGYLARVVGTRGSIEMAEWNDAPDRTLEEVLATFDRAIALAEAEAT